LIGVIIPCYRVGGTILELLARVGPECERIYVVDDQCPDRTADRVTSGCRDPRLVVLRHESNQGVGGATMTGYRRALADGCTIVVKLDGDGQMDPALIPRLVAPIVRGDADYTKGNRFFDLAGLGSMPASRLLGNAALSFMSKLSSGYWSVFDPTNGYTALHGQVLARIPLERVSRRWFFESDLLFQLGILRAVVLDVPMVASYGDERSSLRPASVILEFAWKHLRNTVRRLFYSYFLRDFSVASLQLLLGPLLMLAGTLIGAEHWIQSSRTGQLASPGTVMLAALPIVAGLQLLLGFLAFDMQNSPQKAVHPRLS
jgi:glycosyltransferase involved in cell wall biosynthesis